MQAVIAKVMAKVFALDNRSSVVEYGVIAAVLVTAVVSALLAMSDSLSGVVHALLGGPRGF